MSLAAGRPKGNSLERANSPHMSTIVGIAQMRSPTEAGLAERQHSPGSRPGVVVPLRAEQAAEPAVRTAPPELGPLSPELALIDPELAAAARAQLPDLPRATPARVATAAGATVEEASLVEKLRSGLEPSLEEAAPRRSSPLGRLTVAGAGLIAVAVLLALLVRQDWPVQDAEVGLPTAASPIAPEPTGPTPAGSRPPEQPPAAPAAPDSPVRTPIVPGQTFVWAPVPGTAGYEFQLFRGNRRVFRARVVEPRLELPGSWRQDGRVRSLSPGSYRWYVWPVSSRTKRRSTVAVVQARLVIEESS